MLTLLKFALSKITASSKAPVANIIFIAPTVSKSGDQQLQPHHSLRVRYKFSSVPTAFSIIEEITDFLF